MKLQVLVDDQDKGSVELTGGYLQQYAHLLACFAQLVSDIYTVENPHGPDWLDVQTNVSLRADRRQAGRRRTA